MRAESFHGRSPALAAEEVKILGADLGIRLLERCGACFECVKSDFGTLVNGTRWLAVMVPGKRSAHTAEEARVRETFSFQWKSF